MRLVRDFFALLPALAFAPIAPAATLPLRAGVAAVDITPSVSALNWAGKGEPYSEVIDPLHARILVLASGEERVAILTLDITQTNENDVAEIRGAITAATGIPSAHILVNASHTHSGPLSAGYRWIGFPDKRKTLIRILLQGKEGTPGFPSGMPAASSFTDMQIAGLLTYIRNSWGLQAGAIGADQVTRVRRETGSRLTPWTDAELAAATP